MYTKLTINSLKFELTDEFFYRKTLDKRFVIGDKAVR